jgi:hypothetical protein
MYLNLANKMGSAAMVCPKCKAQRHEECPKGTWCNCQCRVLQPAPQGLALTVNVHDGDGQDPGENDAPEEVPVEFGGMRP